MNGRIAAAASMVMVACGSPDGAGDSESTDGYFVDASRLTGTIDPERFSAIGDLSAEGAIGPSADQVAAGDHTHPDLAPAAHDHDERYSPIGHDHDERYSPIGHDHDERYSPIGHDHDADYAPSVHDHDARNDGRYARLDHGHPRAQLTRFEDDVDLGLQALGYVSAEACCGDLAQIPVEGGCATDDLSSARFIKAQPTNWEDLTEAACYQCVAVRTANRETTSVITARLYCQ